MMTAGLLTVPTSPSRRTKVAGAVGAAPSSTPSFTKMACTVSAARCWFFGENGSIDGGMIQALPAGIHDGTYVWRENTHTSAAARCGRRNSHAARVTSSSQSTPMWQRHTTRAPACASGAASPAVCGSCSSTTSPGRIRATSSTAFAAIICA